LIHKSRNRLFLAAFAYLLAAVALILWLPAMRIAIVIAIISGLTAAYLFVWACWGELSGVASASDFQCDDPRSQRYLLRHGRCSLVKCRSESPRRAALVPLLSY
jgi:hypothetical protein